MSHWWRHSSASLNLCRFRSRGTMAEHRSQTIRLDKGPPLDFHTQSSPLTQHFREATITISTKPIQQDALSSTADNIRLWFTWTRQKSSGFNKGDETKKSTDAVSSKVPSGIDPKHKVCVPSYGRNPSLFEKLAQDARKLEPKALGGWKQRNCASKYTETEIETERTSSQMLWAIHEQSSRIYSSTPDLFDEVVSLWFPGDIGIQRESPFFNPQSGSNCWSELTNDHLSYPFTLEGIHKKSLEFVEVTFSGLFTISSTFFVWHCTAL
jgi:hypothetical protein